MIQETAISAMPKDMLPNVPWSGEPFRTSSIEWPLGWKKITLNAKNGSTQSMNFKIPDVTNAQTSVSKICWRRNRDVFDEEGTYFENKASGRKVPMRVDKRSPRD